MVDIVGGLQALGAGVNFLKELAQAKQEYDKAGLQLEAAKLMKSMATVEAALTDAQREMRQKDEEITRLQESFRVRNEEMVEYRGYHFRRSAAGEPMGMPYCPRCLQEGKTMMLVRGRGDRRIKNCPECQREFNVSERAYQG